MSIFLIVKFTFWHFVEVVILLLLSKFTRQLISREIAQNFSRTDKDNVRIVRKTIFKFQAAEVTI